LRNVLRALPHAAGAARVTPVRPDSWRRSLVAFVMVVLWLTGVALSAEYSEDAVKAAFLHRFAAYVEWPPSADTDAPFVIAVADADGVQRELERLLPAVTVQDRRARVVAVNRPEELGNARILYLGADGSARRRALIEAASRRHVLVVTDAAGGLELGSAINFVRDGRRVRFEISLPAAARHGLKIKSDLLSVATRVTDAATEGTPR
jgi:hypothetical protein